MDERDEDMLVEDERPHCCECQAGWRAVDRFNIAARSATAIIEANNAGPELDAASAFFVAVFEHERRMLAAPPPPAFGLPKL